MTTLPGNTTISAQWLVDAYAANSPDVFVLDLGTNDLLGTVFSHDATGLAVLVVRVSAIVA